MGSYAPSKEISLDPPHKSAFLEITVKPAANNLPSTAHVSVKTINKRYNVKMKTRDVRGLKWGNK